MRERLFSAEFMMHFSALWRALEVMRGSPHVFLLLKIAQAPFQALQDKTDLVAVSLTVKLRVVVLRVGVA